MAELTVHLLGLTFPNPVLCGAGPQGNGSAELQAALAGGAGGLVTRTVAPGPEYLPSRSTRAPYGNGGLLSSEGPSARMPETWLTQTLPSATAAARLRSVPFIASLTGTAAEVRNLGPALVAAGAEALEFATSHLPWPEVELALRALREAVSVPIIAKLTLVHGEDIAERAAQLEPLVDAFTCMDRFGPVLDIDVEAGGKPRLDGARGYGFLSGSPIHPIAVRTVFAVANRVQKPVIASGGALTTHDVVQFLEVGAALVQVTTGAILKGPAIYGQLAEGLSAWLDEHGHANVGGIQDAYRRKYGHGQRVVLDTEESPQLADPLCIRCGICGEVCYYDAVAAPRRQLPALHAANCFQCGLCVSACPTGALSFRPREAVTRLPTATGEVQP